MSSVKKVLITDHPWPELDIEQRALSEIGAELVDAPDGSEATLVRCAAGVDAIMTCWAKVTEAVMAAAPNCRHVARMGIGLDNIDVAAATRRGMMVTNVPDYCIEEVADHALALLLACSRRITWLHLRTKQGEYNLAACPPMRRLKGQTLGLLGLGRIGRRTAEKALGIGLNVIAHTASGNDYGTGLPMVSLNELLERSDYLSLHAPLTDGTRKVINAESLARMKPTAFIINTSRGGLIDEQALLAAIEGERLAGAGLDVFDPEPPSLSDPLFRDERVIATPHAAFVSEEALRELRERVAVQICQVLTGVEPENIVNR